MINIQRKQLKKYSIALVLVLTLAFGIFWILKTSATDDNTSEPLPPSPPTNVTYSVGKVCDNPIVTIDWDAGRNPNLQYTNTDPNLQDVILSDVTYRIEKEVDGQKVDIFPADNKYNDDGTKNLTAGGKYTDLSMEWDKTYTFRIYAIDTENQKESAPAEITVEVKPAQDDYEPCLDGLNLEITANSDAGEIKLTWDKPDISNEKYEFRITRKTDGVSDGVIKTIKQDEVSSNLTSNGQRMQDINRGLTRDYTYHYKVELYWSGAETQIPDRPAQTCTADTASPQPSEPLSTTAVDWDPEILNIISNNEPPADNQITINIPTPEIALIPPVTDYTASGSDVPTNDVTMRVELSNTENQPVDYSVAVVSEDGSVANSYSDQINSGDNIIIPQVEDANSQVVVTFKGSADSVVMDSSQYNSLASDNTDVSQVGTISVRIDDSTPPTPQEAIQQAEIEESQQTQQLVQTNPAFIQLQSDQERLTNEINELTKQMEANNIELNDPNTSVEEKNRLLAENMTLDQKIHQRQYELQNQQTQILNTAFDQQSLITPEMQASRDQFINLDSQQQTVLDQDQAKLDQIQFEQNKALVELQASMGILTDPCVLEAITHLTPTQDIQDTQCAQKVTDYRAAEKQILGKYFQEQQPLIQEINQELTQTQDEKNAFLGQSTDFVDFMVDLPQETYQNLENSYQEVKQFIIEDIFNPVKNIFSSLINTAYAQENNQPNLILYQQTTNQDQQKLTNNTLDSTNQTLIIEAHNFKNTKNYQLYLDDKFMSEGKVLGDGFAVKLTLPKTTKPGSHKITLLGDATNEQAKTNFTLTKNSYLTQRYWAIGIIAAVLILLMILIIVRVRIKKRSVNNPEVF